MSWQRGQRENIIVIDNNNGNTTIVGSMVTQNICITFLVIIRFIFSQTAP